MRNESKPFGERLRLPSEASGAVATKKTCCAWIIFASTSLISVWSLPTIAPEPRRQVAACNCNLLARGEILYGESIRLHFVLTHDEDVLRADFRRGLERFLQAESVVSQFHDQIVTPPLACQPCRLAVQPGHGSNINNGLAQHALSRSFFLKRHDKAILANRES